MSNSVLARNILLLEALEEISTAAAEKSLKLILLKGSALLTEGVYRPDEREMTDLDILIRPDDEKNFDILLTGLGFKPMENSSQAYYRMASPSAPPVIVDLHTVLRHLTETSAAWHRCSRFSLSMRFPVLSLEDQFLHLAGHNLLHHGELGSKTINDLSSLLEFAYRHMDRSVFWIRNADLAAENGLRPLIYPVLSRLARTRPDLLSEAELAAFAPIGFEKLKNYFFERAAIQYSNTMEYMLPGLLRPALFIKYLFPGKTFLEKRYGKASWTNRLVRPFQLIYSMLKKED